MRKYAYIQNLRIPSEKAHSIYIVKTCEAAAKLEFKTHLIIPIITSKNPVGNFTICEYYNLKPNIFKINRISTLPDKIKLIIEKILSVYIRFVIDTSFFTLKAWKFARNNNITIIQSADYEVVVIFSLLSFIHPVKIIYDAHIDPPGWFITLFAKRIDKVAASSQFYEEQFRRAGSESVDLLPNGFEPDDYIPTETNNTIRKKLGIDPKRYVIGYIGRFETLGEEKGIHQLIRAAHKIRKKIPLTVLLVGGPESYAKQYQKQAERLGYTEDEIILIPQVKPYEVAQYTMAIDLAWMVYPDTERFRYKMSPMKAIEYLAAGKQIIASDFPSIRQIIPEHLCNYVNPNDIDTLCTSINKIIAKHDQNSALDRIEYAAQFSWIKRQQNIFRGLE